MRPLNAREKTFAKITALVALLVILDRGVRVIPWGGVSRIDREITRQQDQLIQDRLALRHKDRILREYRNSVPGSSKGALQGMNGLLNEIESLARSSGVKIQDITPQTAVQAQDQWSAAVVLESSWPNLARFSYELQKSAKVLSIDKATFRRKTDTDPTLQGRFVISQREGAP